MAGTWAPPPGWQAICAEVFRVKGRRCHWCGRPATTVDHVVAQIVGGGSELANLVPACSRCNYSRGARLGNMMRGRRVRLRPVPPPEPWRPSRSW